MNRVIRLALVLVVTSLAARLLYTHLVSDETQIRWVIEDMVDGFNAAHAGKAVYGLARDWKHQGRPVDREILRGYLFRDARESRDKDTKEYLWKVELPKDSLSIRVDDEGKSAQLSAHVVFSYDERKGKKERRWEPRWVLRLEADLAKLPNGWRIVASRHEDLQGTMLGH